MSYSISFRARAIDEIRDARGERGGSFDNELERVFEVLRVMPLRFPVIHGAVHRALLRRHRFSIFFRVRGTTNEVVILAVLPQRANPGRWP